jgi:hypothetical protein
MKMKKKETAGKIKGKKCPNRKKLSFNRCIRKKYLLIMGEREKLPVVFRE